MGRGQLKPSNSRSHAAIQQLPAANPTRILSMVLVCFSGDGVTVEFVLHRSFL